MLGNFRPEIIALATLIMSVLARLFEHYGITISAADALQLTACMAWAISRILRRYFPDENARNIQEIKSKVTEQLVNAEDKPATASVIANTVPPAVIMAAAKDAAKL